MKRDLPKSDTPLLILSILASGSYHAYALAHEIERRSEETMKLADGTLQSTLRTLEMRGWISSRAENQKKGPAKRVYSLTEEGYQEWERQAAEWLLYARVVNAIVLGNDM